ncbi:hypothetical protein [Halobacterium wangiae]|nr:hypothetical protein [Halobacterium wangiae]
MAEMNARIPLRAETRDELRNYKCDGQTWDDLLCQMAEVYETEAHRA